MSENKLVIKMVWYTNVIVLVLFIIQCETIEIKGPCPEDMATKLRTNWLAMHGKWYEVMRCSKITPMQAGTSCDALDIINIDQYMLVNHTSTNIFNKTMHNPSIFQLSSEPSMDISFRPGLTKQLTLMGTEYLNVAVFTYCVPKNPSKINPTSEIYFWVFCRQNTLTPSAKKLVTLIFDLKKVENMLPYLQYNGQESCL